MNGDFRVGSLLIQPGLNAISKNGTSTRVEPKVMQVLVCLAEHPGEVVSKQQLLESVWPGTFVSEDVLTRSISELRRAFDDDARGQRIIETIPKRGYRLAAPIANGPASGVHNQPASSRLHPGKILSPRFTINRWLPVYVGAAILISMFLAFELSGTRGHNDRIPPIRSLAVLPLKSLSDDAKQAYFAEGVSDALITNLAQISALRVTSRTTTLRYKDTHEPLPQVAHELNVDGIVEGTVQRSGNHVRVTAQLVYGPADKHVWANSYEREVSDILDLQRTVASEIAREIQVKVTPEEETQLKHLQPVNPKALDAYVEAKFHLEKAGKLQYYYGKRPLQKQETLKAASYLDLAIQSDPAYLPAYVTQFDLIDPDLKFLPKARAALIKALQLDNRNVAAHIALGRLLMQYDYDWPGAESEFKKAIESNPNSAEAHNEYADYLKNIGRTHEGDNEQDLAQALDLAHDYFGSAGVERRGRTLEQQRQVLEEQAPTDPFALAVMGKDYAIAGRFHESVEMWERSLSLYGWREFVNVLRRAEAERGPRFALEEWMRAGERYSTDHADMPVEAMAFTYSSLGDKDRAFLWLDKAVEQRHWMIIYLKVDDVWNPLRSDPRFKALLTRVRLAR